MTQLPSSLTLANASSALDALRASATAPGSDELRLDASRLGTFDSAALALLLHARRLAQSTGRTLHIAAAPPQLTQLAQLYGVAELLGLHAATGPSS